MRNLPFIAAALAALVASPSHAGETDWLDTEGAKLRLVALPGDAPGKLRAGLQIALKPGWKTYWRSPGASGLPPQLDFSKSQNVAATKISYPAPIAFGSGEALTAGYKGTVTLPISVDALFSDKPVTLAVSGLIGVCEEICIPQQFSLSLDGSEVTTSSLASATALNAAELTMPKPAKEGFRVHSVRVDGGHHLHVEADLPDGTFEATLFPEGPFNWYLEPGRAKVADGKAIFRFPLPETLDIDSAIGTDMGFTLVAGSHAVEQRVAVAR